MQKEATTLRGVRAGLYVNPERNVTSLEVELPLSTWSRMGSPALVHCNATHNAGLGLLVFTLTPSALRSDNVFAVGTKSDGKKKRIQARLPESFNAALKNKIPITKTEKATLLPRSSGGAIVTATLNTRSLAPDPTIGKPLAEVFAEESKPDDRPFAGTKPMPYSEQLKAMSRGGETLELHREQVALMRSQAEAMRQFYDRTEALNRRSTASLESIAVSLKLINNKMKD